MNPINLSLSPLTPETLSYSDIYQDLVSQGCFQYQNITHYATWLLIVGVSLRFIILPVMRVGWTAFFQEWGENVFIGKSRLLWLIDLFIELSVGMMFLSVGILAIYDYTFYGWNWGYWAYLITVTFIMLVASTSDHVKRFKRWKQKKK